MKRKEILKRLFADDTISIPAVDGSKTISKSKDVFKGWIDPNFQNWGLNKLSQETSEIKTLIYEMVKDTNYSQMFNSLTSDLDKLCLTQNQIVEFCIKNQKYLEDVRSTFFLIKRRKCWQVRNRYFVIGVDVDSDGLGVNVDHFNHDDVWRAEYRRRLVVPQLLVV